MAKLVFITGASSGLGQAMALKFYREGYSLALVARRAEAIEVWASEQGLEATRYAVYTADVTHDERIIAAAQACIAAQGLPDVVIANAGISIGMDSAVRGDIQVMRDVYAANVFGVAATFHPFIDAMRARGSGSLVGIASVAGIRGLPGHGAYSSSKAAVIAYCESVRCDLRGSGVQVQTVLPGYVATPLTAKNRFSMPFIITAEVFAERAYKVISAGCSYAVIPWQMGLVAKLLRLLPNGLYDKVLAGRPKKRRIDE